jgi:hypothetical protein
VVPRVKPHFKLHTSIKNHRKTAEMVGKNDLFATYCRLGILAIERYADRTSDTFEVHDRELGWITGKHRADAARRSLRYLADISPISVEYQGDTWRIKFPKFAQKQGFQFRNGARMGDSPSPSPSLREEEEKKKKPRAPSEPAREVCNRAWTAAKEAALAHGIPWGGALETWIARLRPRLREHRRRGDQALAQAIHGYCHFNEGRSDDWPWRKFCRPVTLLQKDKFASALEAYDQKRAREVRRRELEATAHPPPSEADLAKFPKPVRIG